MTAVGEQRWEAPDDLDLADVVVRLRALRTAAQRRAIAARRHRCRRYAGATILGAGSSIGGNVWLTHNVPPGSNITQAKARNESFNEGGGI